MKPARRALSFIRPYRGLFLVGQIATLGAAAAGLAFPLITRDVVDGLIGGTASRGLTVPVSTTLLILGGAFLFLAAFTFAKERSLRFLSLRVVYDLRDQVYDKIQRLKYAYFDRNPSGDIISTMTNDINRFQDSVAGGLSFLISQSVSLVAIVVLLFTIDAVLTLVVLAMVPVVFIVIRVVAKRVRSLSRRVQDLLGELTSIAGETVRGIDVIKSYVLAKPARRLFAATNRDVLEVGQRQAKWSSTSAAVSTLLGGVAIVTLIGVGGLHVRRGMLTPGELVAYIIYAQMIVGPIGMLSGIVVEVQRAIAAIERVFALLDAEEESAPLPQALTAAGSFSGGAPAVDAGPEVVASGDAAEIGGTTGRGAEPTGAALSLEGVSFRYDGGAPALRDVSLHVAPGEFVALVGPSGAGKSTLLKLLVRFYDPTEGRILLDDVDVTDLPVETIRQEMALVMQETHLFDMSVEENLRCGKLEAGRSEIADAAGAAEAAQFIEQLPEGYENRIGENGTQLSGGQRQRLSLARAFLKSPRVLLLDEATSSLDTESERRIQSALGRLMSGRTTVAIAHRLSTVLHADRIYLMDDGRIIDVGPHDDLVRRSPLYARLCKHQMIQAPG